MAVALMMLQAEGVSFTISDAGYYIASGTFSFGNGGEDFYLIKTDLAGISSCNEEDFNPDIQNITLIHYNPVLISGNIIFPQVVPATNDIQPGEELICSDTLVSTQEQSLFGSTQTSVYPNPAKELITVWFGAEIESGKLLIANGAGVEINEILLKNNKSMNLDISILSQASILLS